MKAQARLLHLRIRIHRVEDRLFDLSGIAGNSLRLEIEELIRCLRRTDRGEQGQTYYEGAIYRNCISP